MNVFSVILKVRGLDSVLGFFTDSLVVLRVECTKLRDLLDAMVE